MILEEQLLKLLNLYGKNKGISYFVDLILTDNFIELDKIILQIYKKSKKDYSEVI